MKILGTNFYGQHDSALFYIDTNKKEIFAMSTERITRNKHDGTDISPILESYKFSDINYVCHGYSVFHEPLTDDLNIISLIKLTREKALRALMKPKYIKDLNLSRNEKISAVFSVMLTQPINSIKNLLIYFSAGNRLNKATLHFSTHEIIEKYMLKLLSKYSIIPEKIDFYDHHLCHTAGAYYFSPFAYKYKTLSITLDASGDGFFSKLFIFDGDKYEEVGKSPIKKVEKVNSYSFGDFSSIGVIYGNFTKALGLRPFSDEGKVEALAAFSEKDEDLYNQLMSATIISAESVDYNVKMLEPLYDMPFLQGEIERMGQKKFAATVQSYLEDIVVTYLNKISEHHNVEYLCLSGGVAANIIMSLNIYERTKFKNIFVLPYMGDEGVAVGSALIKAVEMGEDISWVNKHNMPYFGNSLTDVEIKEAITFYDDRIIAEYIGETWYRNAAKTIADDKVVAVVHGRMEFGPRALGNRSILANPVNPDIREQINLKVKKRPIYQPFCPSILEDERERLFENSFPHKHMAIAFRVKKEFHEQIPSAVHVDGTARPQFVESSDNPTYYKLLKEVKKYTGFGVVINTSFNLHGRTIVHTAKDAILDFLDCNIDELYIEGFRITRL